MADNLDPDQINKLNQAFEELNRTTGGLDRSFHNTGVSTEKVGKHFDSLVKKLDAVNKKLDENVKKDKKHQDSKKEEIKDLDKLRDRTGIASKALEEFAKANGKLGQSVKASIEQFQQIADTKQRMSEINKVLGSTNHAIAEDGKIIKLRTAELNKELKLIERENKMREYYSNLFSSDTLGKAMGELAKTSAGFAKGLAKGDTSFTSLNPIIDLVANGLSSLVKEIPLVGGALSAATKATAEASKFMIEQIQGALKDFQDVSKFGGLVSDGMSGLQRQFIASGMSMDGFKRVIKDNADALATFGGTVGKGGERFSKMVGSMTTKGGAFEKLGDDLRRLGMTADDIGESAGLYLEQEIRLGRTRGKTDAQLTEGAAKYAKELDALQKLTGESKEALQKQRDALLSDARFREVYEEERAKGNEKGVKSLQNLITIMGKDSEMGLAMKDLSAGMYTTANATKAAVTFGDEFRQLTDDVKNNRITEDQAMARIAEMSKSAAEGGKGIAKILGADSPFINQAQLYDTQARLSGKSMAEALKTQKGQTQQTDVLTDKTVDAQKNMEQLSRTMKNLAFGMMPNAAKAVAKFTDSLDEFVDWMAEKLDLQIGTESDKERRKLKKEVASLEEKLKKAEIEDAGNQYDALGNVISTGGGNSAQAIRDELANKKGQLQKSSALSRAGGVGGNALAGLKLKQGDVQAAGAEVDPMLVELAQRIQAEIPGFNYFSAFNDKYHQENAPESVHTQGKALDFTLGTAPTKEQGAKIADMLRGMGFKTVIDEYNNPSSKATAGHFHAAIAARGGIFRGPQSGYPVILHGNEMVQPLPNVGMAPPTQNSLPSTTGSNSSGISDLVFAMIDKLDEMIDQQKRSNRNLDEQLTYAKA